MHTISFRQKLHIRERLGMTQIEEDASLQTRLLKQGHLTKEEATVSKMNTVTWFLRGISLHLVLLLQPLLLLKHLNETLVL
jgi:hypothetical protein